MRGFEIRMVKLLVSGMGLVTSAAVWARNRAWSISRTGSDVASATVAGLTALVVGDRHVGHATWWATVVSSWIPTVRMGDAIDHRWAVAGGIVAVQIRIIVAATTVVVVAVTNRIVAPARVSGVDEDGGGKRVISVGGTISWTVGATYGRGVGGFVGAGI